MKYLAQRRVHKEFTAVLVESNLDRTVWFMTMQFMYRFRRVVRVLIDVIALYCILY